MKKSRVSIALPLAAAAALTVGSVQALTVTPAGTGLGFSLSEFASGFPDDGGLAGNSPIGPVGITFPTSGGVMVADANGNLYSFANDTNGQTVSQATLDHNYGTRDAYGLAVDNGNVYMTQQQVSLTDIFAGSTGSVEQVGNTGLPVGSVYTAPSIGGFTPSSAPTEIVKNPNDGNLLVGLFFGNSIVDLNPASNASTTLISGIPGHPDGFTLSPDGKTLYVVAEEANGNHILGYNAITGAATGYDSGVIAGADGLSVGVGTLSSDLFVNTNGGTVDLLNLSANTQTVIADSGTRGDFVVADPNNPSLLITQDHSVWRLTAPTGGGFAFGGAPTVTVTPPPPPPTGAVPEPSSLALIPLGLIALAVRRRFVRSLV